MYHSSKRDIEDRQGAIRTYDEIKRNSSRDSRNDEVQRSVIEAGELPLEVVLVIREQRHTTGEGRCDKPGNPVRLYPCGLAP